MKCFVLNGWAAGPDAWDLCAFRRDRIFGYGEQLDGIPEQVMETVDAAVLVGWSMGGSSALRLALAYPGKVRGLVLVAATPRMMESREEGWAGMSERRLQSLLLGTRMMNEGSAAPEFDEALMSRGIDYLRTTDIRRSLEAAVTPGSPLARIPVAIFQSERDGIVRPGNADFLQRIFPQAIRRSISGAEHRLSAAIPAEIDSAVRSMVGA